MSLIFGQEGAPSAPSSGKAAVFLDSADSRMKHIKSDGSSVRLGPRSERNLIANGTFAFAQRQAPGTLTTYSNTSGRTYGPDRWGITNENASAQFKRVDTIDSPETGLGSRFYGHIKKITNAGKVIVSQVMEAVETAPLRGRSVRVQFMARNVTGTHTLRCALLYLTSSGTADSIPATFVSAFGGVGTDPTWGTNLTAIVPSLANSASSISGSGLSCVLSSSWQQFGGVFSVPATCKNLVVVLFTNGQPADGNEFAVSEVGLHEGEEEREILFDAPSELLRCLRYCSKTFDLDTAPAQALGVATGEFRWIATQNGNVNQRAPTFNFHTRMRVAPTVTTYNPFSANDKPRDENSSSDCGSPNVNNVTDRSLFILAAGNVATTVGNALGIHFLLEAEL